MISVADYRKPSSRDEALELLSSGDYRVIAGGTDLIPQLRHGDTRKLLDIGRLGLSFIITDQEYIEIGAVVTHTQISTNQTLLFQLPLLARASGQVGSWQIRNRGTVGGNLVNASPCADTAPALLNYDAEIILLSRGGKRILPLADFIQTPYQTLIRSDELLYSIRCRKLSQTTGHSYIKLGRRQAVNIARMSLAVTLAKDENDVITRAVIAAGSVFPKPSRISGVENMLCGQKITPTLFREAGCLAAQLMINESGYRWSTPYKKPVLEGLIERALREASGMGGST